MSGSKGWDSNLWGSTPDTASPEQHELELRDRQLGTVVALLERRDQTKAVGYLLSADKVTLRVDTSDWGWTHYDLVLVVEIARFDDFSDEAVHQNILDAYGVVLASDQEAVNSVVLQPSLVPLDWREKRKEALTADVTNQAALAPLPPKHPVVDGLNFRDQAEVMVYKALRHLQSELPNNATIGIMPNCAIRVKDYTWEPDFVVTYQGRVGVIEVDGRTHLRKRSSDASREVLLQKAGVILVRRIDVIDAEKPAEALGLAKDLVDAMRLIR